MEREILYMLGIVTVGFLVNYTLRALPFLLFSGRDRELPSWVLKFGDFISPVIIAGLIIYSYSGLEWKTAWPYLAGGLTVGLQLWRKNSLLSIVVGTILYMFLVSGCTTVREVQYGVDHPILALDENELRFNGNPVRPQDVPDLLEEYQIPRDAVIHIGISPAVQRNLKPVRTFMAFLAMRGYRRSVLVTDMHGESAVVDRTARGGSAAVQNANLKKVRYRGANE